MALPYPIAPSQTDAKSPMDDNLMDSIRLDLDYLDLQITGGSFTFMFNINGQLRKAAGYKKPIDTGILFSEMTPATCRAVLKKSGTSGNLKFDIRRLTTPRVPITAISHQYEGSTQSIARVSAAINTQSIQRSIAQVNTQSIARAKAQLSIQSIINVGANLWRYNFSGALLDADYQVGKFITFASCTNAANDGTFAIVEINQSGYPSIVVTNVSGVAQSGAAGNANLCLWSYNFTNPVDADFVVGESALLASHTSGNNNGTLEIYKVNEAGNNVWIYNQTGVAQAGVAGTMDVLRWIFAYSSAVPTPNFTIGERALMASHTSGNNNGNLRIVDINRGGNNLIIYNSIGVVQGGAVGNASPNRWVYALSTDPSANVSVGDSVSFEGHTTSANNGIFTVKSVNVSAGNNLVINNESGVAQAGVAGNIRHTRKLVQFESDQSSIFTTDSFIEMEGTESSTYWDLTHREQFRVLQVNRGGGANYNVVIDGQNNPSQASPAGYVMNEMKSIFTGVPTMPVEVTGNNANEIVKFSTTNFVPGSIPANVPVLLYLTEVPEGNPEDLTVILS